MTSRLIQVSAGHILTETAIRDAETELRYLRRKLTKALADLRSEQIRADACLLRAEAAEVEPPTGYDTPTRVGLLMQERDEARAKVARLEAELSAAENQGAPEGWTQGDGAWCWDGDGTGLDSTQVRVYHARGYDPRAPARPYARIVRSRSVGVDVIDLDADTVLAAIEAAEAWLDEHHIEGVVP